jgi:hypothetical protein
METLEATLDRVPIKDLIGDRYNKSMLYRMFSEMNIVPTKVGREGFITPEQERMLEQYALAKASGKEALEAFLSNPSGNVSKRFETFEADYESADLAPLEQNQPSGVWLLVEAIATRLQQAKPEPLALQRQLEEVAEHGWHLSTAQLREILGTGPVEGDRYGFRFSKSGKMGRQMGWKVEKN